MLLSENFWPNVIILLIGIAILAAIYFTGRWNSIVGSIVLGIGFYFFLQLTQAEFNDSDSAGNGMAEGFTALFHIAASIVAAVAFLLFMKFSSNTDKVMLVSMVVLGVIFIVRFLFFVFTNNEP